MNQAFGGNLDDFDPAIEWFTRDARRTTPIVPKQTSYARVVPARSRSCSTTISTPTAAKYKDKANVAFVIPAEGTVIVPYVMAW